MSPRFRTLAITLAAPTLDVVFFSNLVPQLLAGGYPGIAQVAVGWTTATALLHWRRRSPIGIVLLLCLHSTLFSVMTAFRPVLSVCVGLATLASTLRFGRSWPGYGAAIFTVASWVVNEHRLYPNETSPLESLAIGTGYAVVLSASVGVGLLQRMNKWRLRHQDLEHQRQEQWAVQQERARVARELHDIVTHAVTVMILQASAARRLLGVDAERAAIALGAVEDAGTRAIDELRKMLGVLEGAGDPAAEQLPGLDDVPLLIENARAAGSDIELIESGLPKPLDSSVSLAAYRVVQESLSNVFKHGGPNPEVKVFFDWRTDLLVLSVHNSASKEAPAKTVARGGGSGLKGLQQRIRGVGGTIDARPTIDGGFVVEAQLPISAADEAESLQTRPHELEIRWRNDHPRRVGRR